MTVLKKKRASIRKNLKPLAPVIRSWYLDVALDFMCSRNLNEVEEAFMEDITDFYLKAVEDLGTFSEKDEICPFLKTEMKKDLAHRLKLMYNEKQKGENINAEQMDEIV